QLAPKDSPIHFICETDLLRDVLCKDLGASEDLDWLGFRNRRPLRTLVNILRQRCATTSFRKADSSDEWKSIVLGRSLTMKLAIEHGAITVQAQANPDFNLSGARLSKLSQRTAYRLIRRNRATATRTATERITLTTLEHINKLQKSAYQMSDLWRSIRRSDIRRPVSDFLWKCLHNAYRCGHFWARIPNYEDRATCTTCGVEDSMQHILSECRAPGQREAWKLTGQLWRRKQAVWTKPKLEDILSLGLRHWTSTNDKKRPFVERMWRIMISEVAYLIWCLRCERTIGHADDPSWNHSPKTIAARWEAMMNRRLHLDAAMSHRRFGRLALQKKVVLNTWCGTLRDEQALPDDWTVINRVLVGINPSKHERLPG
ncbi:uncharacterized protein C8Q71DRAFT_880229, partial [Rhodofomes roseus]